MSIQDKLKLTCQCCKKVYDINRTDEIPKHIHFMHCNFCIECDFNNRMTDYYNEWWDDKENEVYEKYGTNYNGEQQLKLPI